MNNYLVKIKVKVSDEDSGKEKFKNEQYLVQDESPTAVEITMTNYFKDTTIEWELTSIVKTNILNVIFPSTTKVATANTLSYV